MTTKCIAQGEWCRTVAKARKISLEPTWALEDQRLLELKRPQLQQKLKELDKNESELYGARTTTISVNGLMPFKIGRSTTWIPRNFVIRRCYET